MNGRRRVVWLQLLIPCVIFTLFALQVCADTKHPPPAHSVDLNSATADELQQVPGIGPRTAKATVNFRQKSGPFQKSDDLLAIKGLSKGRLEKMHL
jgi:competence ComEA-like helix-hairpin-helix protein